MQSRYTVNLAEVVTRIYSPPNELKNSLKDRKELCCDYLCGRDVALLILIKHLESFF